MWWLNVINIYYVYKSMDWLGGSSDLESLGWRGMVLDGFIYKLGFGRLVGLGKPHLMSARWAAIFCQMGNVSLTIQQASLGFFTWCSQGCNREQVHFQASACIMFAPAS